VRMDDAVNRVKVMKLLWDAIGSEFGAEYDKGSSSTVRRWLMCISRPIQE
jgi:aromatic ring hydroxylase